MGALEDISRQPGQRFAPLKTIPAPVKGWNTIDPLAAMDPQYAVQLDNWIPQPGYVALRQGSQAWESGLPNPIWSFVPYFGPSFNRLFGMANTAIYDVTVKGGTAGDNVFSITSPYNWSWEAFSTEAGDFTVACNGTDPALYYDGSNWIVSPITGVQGSLFLSVTSYQGRLWFTERESLHAWYLAPGAITGAATLFDLGTVFHRGGAILAVASYCPDAGNGPNNYLAFVTSAGECAIYQGIDPSSISTFALVGVYRIPNPIGSTCLLRFASDLLILTQQGVYPISKALINSTINRSSAITYTISSQFAADYAKAGLRSGWSMCLCTQLNLLIVNVPLGDPTTSGSAQYVMNTITGAWCRILGMNASAFVEFNGNVIFGNLSVKVLPPPVNLNFSAVYNTSTYNSFVYNQT